MCNYIDHNALIPQTNCAQSLKLCEGSFGPALTFCDPPFVVVRTACRVCLTAARLSGLGPVGFGNIIVLLPASTLRIDGCAALAQLEIGEASGFGAGTRYVTLR